MKAKWWQFWRPSSGLPGGLITGALLLLLIMLLSGCTGANVVETTTEKGITLTTVNVHEGSVMTWNQQTGDLCIDSAGAQACNRK